MCVHENPEVMLVSRPAGMGIVRPRFAMCTLSALITLLVAGEPMFASTPSPSMSARTAAAQGAGPVVEAERGGDVSAVATVGDHAYVAVGRRLLVLARSDVDAGPVETGATLMLPARSMDGEGDLLVVATGAPGIPGAVAVVDIGRPTRPRIVGRLVVRGAPRQVALETRADGSRWAWVALGVDGLLRVDVGDPTAPRVLDRWSPPDVDGKAQRVHGVVGAAPRGGAGTASPGAGAAAEFDGVALVLGTTDEEFDDIATDVIWVRAGGVGGGAGVESVGTRSVGAGTADWFAAPGHVVYLSRRFVHVLPIGQAAASKEHAPILQGDTEILRAVVVDDRLVIARNAVSDDGALDLDVHRLVDAERVGSGRVAGVRTEPPLLVHAWSSILVAAEDAVQLVDMDGAPRLVRRWPVSTGRYTQIRAFEGGWLAVTEPGDLQWLDPDGVRREGGLTEEPVAQVFVMGDRLVSFAFQSMSLQRLEPIADPGPGPRWRYGRILLQGLVNSRNTVRVSDDLLGAWGVHGAVVRVARWIDEDLAAYPRDILAGLPRRPAPFLLDGFELWVTNSRGPLDGYRYSGNDREDFASGGVPGSRPFVSTAMAGHERQFVIGDANGVIVHLDMRDTPDGRVAWNMDVPGALTGLALWEEQAWAAWGSPTSGLGAIASSTDHAVPLGDVPLVGTPRQLTAIDGSLWVVQDNGALTRYAFPRVEPVRTPVPTAAATAPSETPAATVTPRGATPEPWAAAWASGRRIALPLVRREQ